MLRLPPVRRLSMPVGQWVIQLLHPTYKSSFLYHGINIHDRRSRGGQPARGGSWGSSGTVDLMVTMEYRPAVRCRLPLRREHGFGWGDSLQLRAISGEALSSKLWVANTLSTWVCEGACGIWGVHQSIHYILSLPLHLLRPGWVQGWSRWLQHCCPVDSLLVKKVPI